MKIRRYIIRVVFITALFIMNTINTTSANEQIEEVLQNSSTVTSKVASPVAFDGEIITNSIGMKFVSIRPSEFWMGSSDNEKYYHIDESPRHLVKLTKGFCIGVTEVTQIQWLKIMKNRPWLEHEYVREGDSYPATYVSWDDAVEFCRELSQKESRKYRLPTEAEWEYICRAGTKTAYSFGNDDSRLGNYAWFKDNAYDVEEKYARTVAQKKPNPWGLYDVHGNIWEWCSDWYNVKTYLTNQATDPKGPSDGECRVLRGGSWINALWECRSATRTKSSPDKRGHYFGFRVVLEVNEPYDLSEKEEK